MPGDSLSAPWATKALRCRICDLAGPLHPVVADLTVVLAATRSNRTAGRREGSHGATAGV